MKNMISKNKILKTVSRSSIYYHIYLLFEKKYKSAYEFEELTTGFSSYNRTKHSEKGVMKIMHLLWSRLLDFNQLIVIAQPKDLKMIQLNTILRWYLVFSPKIHKYTHNSSQNISSLQLLLIFLWRCHK